MELQMKCPFDKSPILDYRQLREIIQLKNYLENNYQKYYEQMKEKPERKPTMVEKYIYFQ